MTAQIITRRAFGMLAAGIVSLGRGALAGQSAPGVRLGVQTYSFRDIPRTADGDAVGPLIAAMTACGLKECELWSPQVEPAGLTRDAIRTWRVETKLDHWREIKRRFDAGGIAIHAFNYSPNKSYTDAEIDRGFEMAKTLCGKA